MVVNIPNEKNNSFTERVPYYSTPHKYNTRLSAKLSRTSLDRKLVVNLVNSKIYPNFINLAEIQNFENRSKYTDRFDDSADEDDNGNIVVRHPQVKFELMDWTNNPCIPQQQPGKSYKNIIALIAALFLIICFVIQIKMDISNLKTDVKNLQNDYQTMVTDLFRVERKLKTLETETYDTKREQELFTKDLINIVKDNIDKYSADRTGRTDFALASLGGRIERLSAGTENVSGVKKFIFGISLCEGTNGPKTMIQSGTSPGECWAFKGSDGGAVIRLLGYVFIDSVTMEHIPKNVSPTGHIITAPKQFTVSAMNSASDKAVDIGMFTYDIDGPPVQTFRIDDQFSKVSYEFVELRIHSNHGHPEFTCVYRFRVHGVLDQFPNGKKM